MLTSSFAIIFSTFFFGLRHGLDWDHLAAITDIVGVAEQKKEAYINSLLYIVGHAIVIICFGILAIAFGLTLPDWVDHSMGKVVGLTIVFLGSVLLYSLIRNRKAFAFQSRWKIIFSIIASLKRFIDKKFNHTHQHSDEKPLSRKMIVSIGMLHGVGAETPTQVLLFVSLSGMKGVYESLLLLLLFVCGLIVSNMLVSIFSLYGLKRRYLHGLSMKIFGIGLAVLNIVIGLLFLLGWENRLPAIFQ